MTKQNKIRSIIMTILMVIMWILIAVIVLLQPKVAAWEDLIKTQNRIAELEEIIEDAQFRYAIAETSKAECIQSWEDQKDKAHDDAEKARIEIKELQGFLMNR